MDMLTVFLAINLSDIPATHRYNWYKSAPNLSISRRSTGNNSGVRYSILQNDRFIGTSAQKPGGIKLK